LQRQKETNWNRGVADGADKTPMLWAKSQKTLEVRMIEIRVN
jgi:hypothetical protein